MIMSVLFSSDMVTALQTRRLVLILLPQIGQVGMLRHVYQLHQYQINSHRKRINDHQHTGVSKSVKFTSIKFRRKKIEVIYNFDSSFFSFNRLR